MFILRNQKQGKFRQWVAWVCLLILVDQASKALIRSTLLPGSRLPFIDNFLFITFIPNDRGFSWFVPELPEWVRLLFFALRLIILVMAFPVYDFYSRSEQTSLWAWIGLIAVSAGVAGNLLDDVFAPYTTDFIQVFQSPSANFADLFSYVGIVALIIELGMHWRQKKLRWRGFKNYFTQRIETGRSFYAFLKGYLAKRS